MNSLPVSVTTLPTTVNKFLSPSFLATSRLMEHVSFPILSSQTGPLNKIQSHDDTCPRPSQSCRLFFFFSPGKGGHFLAHFLISQAHLPSQILLPSPMTKLELRDLGTTGLKLSCVGFGASPLGNVFGLVSEDDAIASVREAFRLGINFFDTSP